MIYQIQCLPFLLRRKLILSETILCSFSYTNSKIKKVRPYMYLLFSIILIIAVLCCILIHCRKSLIMKKICSMSYAEKCQLLNEVIYPFGYHYLPCKDVFYSTFDAWQRDFGYTHSYDIFAPYFNMVLDSEPVYFNYNNHTWLVEFWKGQYGINTGAEIGIYCADGIVSPQNRKHELFHTISDEDIPDFSMKLYRDTACTEEKIADLSMSHWWLAAFRMGYFSCPDELSVDFCINFPEHDMMYAFVDALIRLGYEPCSLDICGTEICFSYKAPLTPVSCGFLANFVRFQAQWKNRLFCQLYLFITRPFCSTLDRLLYLYFYLPFIFRHCLRLRRCKKHTHCRRKGGKL